MQRQSLGSPSSNSSKLHAHGRPTPAQAPAATPSTSSPSSPPVIVPAGRDAEFKLHKVHHRRSLSSPSLPLGPQNLIHFFPIITLLCFLVLFLCSHEPTPADLLDYHGFKNPMKLADSREIDDFERVPDKGERLAIQSIRNLKEFRNTKSNSHRKLADF